MHEFGTHWAVTALRELLGVGLWVRSTSCEHKFVGIVKASALKERFNRGQAPLQFTYRPWVADRLLRANGPTVNSEGFH